MNLEKIIRKIVKEEIQRIREEFSDRLRNFTDADFANDNTLHSFMKTNVNSAKINKTNNGVAVDFGMGIFYKLTAKNGKLYFKGGQVGTYGNEKRALMNILPSGVEAHSTHRVGLTSISPSHGTGVEIYPSELFRIHNIIARSKKNVSRM